MGFTKIILDWPNQACYSSYEANMNLSEHAKKRMIKRSKKASLMRPRELNALIETATPFTKEVKRDHGFSAKYLWVESLNLVLVVNPVNSVIVTCYERNES